MKKASLLVRSGSLQGRTCPISAPLLLGRADDCDLVLGDYQRVSRHHARLEWNAQKLRIDDQNSTNGVLLNGRKVERATLKNGDRLELGDFAATVIIEGAARPLPPVLEKMATRWRDWPVAPLQRWGVVAGAALVLLLGLIGLRPQSTNPLRDVPPSKVPPTANVPTGNDSTSPLPDAGATSSTQNQTVAAIDPVGGRISPTAIQNAKAATVLIAHRTAGGYAMGSGFALSDARRIVTNRHVVVDDKGNPQDCTLIFEAGTPRERKVAVPAQHITLAPDVDGKDAFQDDLASITLDAGQVPALPAGRSEALTETDEVYAVGFPLGVETLTLGGDLPSVSVKPARVERLQSNKNGDVTVIQLGSSVTHGNSGGPVVNNRGEVVGVISSGVEGTGMAYAIPMVFVRNLP